MDPMSIPGLLFGKTEIEAYRKKSGDDIILGYISRLHVNKAIFTWQYTVASIFTKSLLDQACRS